MSVWRDAVVAKLNALDPDTIVRPYAKSVDALEAVTVMVSVVEVRNSKAARGWRDFDIHLDVLTPLTDPDGPADDDLDDALLDVLDLLDSAEAAEIGVIWTTATRADFEGKWPSYRIAATVTTQRIQP